MSLSQFALFMEIAASIAVLVTLIFLALQMRENTRALLAAGAQDTHDALLDFYMELAKDPQLNRIVRVGTVDVNALNEDETGQFFAAWLTIMYNMQNWIFQKEKGALDTELADGWVRQAAGNFQHPGFQHFWNERKHYYSGSLQEYVADIIENGTGFPNHRPLGAAAKID